MCLRHLISGTMEGGLFPAGVLRHGFDEKDIWVNFLAAAITHCACLCAVLTIVSCWYLDVFAAMALSGILIGRALVNNMSSWPSLCTCSVKGALASV